MDDGGICRSRGRDGRDRWKRATSGGGNKTGLHVMRQGTRSWNESRNGSAQNRPADVEGEASVVDVQRWSCRRRRSKKKKTGDAGELIEAKSKRAIVRDGDAPLAKLVLGLLGQLAVFLPLVSWQVAWPSVEE